MEKDKDLVWGKTQTWDGPDEPTDPGNSGRPASNVWILLVALVVLFAGLATAINTRANRGQKFEQVFDKKTPALSQGQVAMFLLSQRTAASPNEKWTALSNYAGQPGVAINPDGKGNAEAFLLIGSSDAVPVCFSRDSKLLIAGGAGEATVWGTRDFSLIQTLTLPTPAKVASLRWENRYHLEVIQADGRKTVWSL